MCRHGDVDKNLHYNNDRVVKVSFDSFKQM